MSAMELRIEGMTCEHCVRAATAALQAVPGVVEVEVHLPDFARVDGSADLRALQTVLAEEGYQAELRTGN